MSNIGLLTDLVLANTSTRPGTLVLPLSTQIPGRTITIKCATGSCAVSTCFISTSGGETFEDGSTIQALTTSYGFMKLSARGGKWFTGATTQPNSYAANTINAATTQATAISTAAMNVSSLSLGSTNTLYTSSSLAYWGPYLLNSGFRTAQPQIFFALAKLMSQVYTLSTYSLAGIENTVSLGSATPSYIYTVSVPTNAKGKNGILMLFFNLYNSAGFATSMAFDYGIYIDGVAQLKGDVGTIRYVQTASGTYAMSAGGIVLGLNGMVSAYPILIPLTISSTASQIQIGLANSSMTMTGVAATSPSVGSNVVTSRGTLNTGDYVPQNTFTATGLATYTVPTTVQGGTVTGVFLYCWGSSGSDYNGNGGSAGFVTGYYGCPGGTVLRYVVGKSDSAVNPNTGGSGGGNGNGGGGFSGVFLSNAGGIVQSNSLVIAGAGAQSGGAQAGGGGGGAGAYLSNASGVGYSGSAGYIYASGYTSVTGGTLSAGGTGIGGASYNGGALTGGGVINGGVGGGGGYYGGGGQNGFNTNQAGGGGSSFAANSITNVIFSAGTTPTSVGQTSIPPGGSTSPFYVSNSSLYGYGGSGGVLNFDAQGLVVIVPAVGTAATQVGVSATLFSA